MRVLFVEDNPKLGATTRSALDRAGFSVDLFATAEEGWLAWQMTSYDAAIRYGDLTYDVIAKELSVGGRHASLSRGESIILERFLRAPDRVITKAHLGDMRDTMARHSEFDPATSERAFDIRANDYVSLALGADLMSAVRRSAPKMSVQMSQVINPDPREALERATVDMAIGYYTDLDGDLRISRLRNVEIVCIVGAATLQPEQRFDLEDYLERPHVCLVLSPGRFTSYTERKIDAALADRALLRRKQMSVATTLAMPSIVASSDMVAMVPRDLAEYAARTYPIQIREVHGINISIEFSLIWHERYEAEPAHRWMRNLIRQAAANWNQY